VGKEQDTEEDKGSTMMHDTYVAAAVGKKACLGMKQCQACSEKIKPVVLCIFELCLTEGIS